MKGVDSWAEWLAALTRPWALLELALLAACLGLAWGVSWLLRRRLPGRHAVLLGKAGIDGVLFPMLALLLAQTTRWVMADQHLPVAVLRVALPVLASLLVIRLVVRVLSVAFPRAPLVRLLERTISWAVWVVMVLWITGLLPIILDELEAIHWKIGGAPVTLRSLLEGALSAAAVLVGALWLSSAIESRLMVGSGASLSVRKMAANATRAGLLLVGLLFALSAAGIPLGALSVLGGGLGVGLGIGLQKLAANYVSGFVILAERSLRIGDTVKVDGFEGRITDISTRYTVIRSVTGRESIVPNELLVTQRVENASFADPKVAMTSLVQVAYGTDLGALMPQLVAAMADVPRVLAEPSPSVQLSAFAADGLELTLVFWIADIENGQGNVRSAVNLAVLRLFTEQHIDIPFPQRVVHGLQAAERSSPA